MKSNSIANYVESFLLSALALIAMIVIILTKHLDVLPKAITFVTFVSLLIYGLAETQCSGRRVLVICYFIFVICGIYLVTNYWVSALNESARFGGYDPIKYYYATVTEYKYSYLKFTAINFRGVIYYYMMGGLVYGFNPIMPILWNALFLLLVGRVSQMVANQFLGIGSLSRFACLWLVIPEVIWFNSISSKDGPVLMGGALTILGAALWTVSSDREKTNKSAFGFMLIGICIVGFLRTVLVIPLVVSVIIGILITSATNRQAGYTLLPRLGRVIPYIVLAAALAIYASFKAGSFGHVFTYNPGKAYSERARAKFESGGETSISKMLDRKSLWQNVALAPFKLAIHIIAPFPHGTLIIPEKNNGSYVGIQSFVQTVSTLMILVMIPFALGVIIYKATRVSQIMLKCVVCMAATFILIIFAGLTYVHTRYRIVIDPYLYIIALAGLKVKIVDIFIIAATEVILVSSVVILWWLWKA